MRRLGLLVCAGMLLFGADEASAQMRFGPQISLGTDSDLGLGGRLTFPLRPQALSLDGVLEGNYFFGGGSGVDSWVDANLNVRLPLPLSNDFTARIGTGINASVVSFETNEVNSDSDTEFGINLLGSVAFDRGRLQPFGELRAILGGAEQVVFTVGFTVGGERM